MVQVARRRGLAAETKGETERERYRDNDAGEKRLHERRRNAKLEERGKEIPPESKKK